MIKSITEQVLQSSVERAVRDNDELLARGKQILDALGEEIKRNPGTWPSRQSEGKFR